MKNSKEELITQLCKSFGNTNVEIRPGIDFIPHAAKVIDSEDIIAGVKSVLDGWLTAGPRAVEFERNLAKYLQIRSASLVNSGSSANLVALSALTSHSLGAERISAGDEIITVAAGFPTTINPIVQVGGVPVFIDVELNTLNVDVNQLELAVSSKTKAVMIAHTLGNPFNLNAVKKFCEKYNLWLIEDNCDALGSKYDDKYTGTFGHISTTSFYPAHHITSGEGGAVFTDKPKLRVLIESFRDWGRDCWCLPGNDNTCKKRFSQSLGELPFGYDHKFVYSHIGFNLKMTDIQAAIGNSQLNKLNHFSEARRRNWNYLRNKFENLYDFFVLPENTPNSNPSWFGFALTIKDSSKVNRSKMLSILSEKKIGTRLLFSGDIRKQPAYLGATFRSVGELPNTLKILNDTFWVGCWPGLTEIHLDFIYESIRDICLESI
jgi:CDP-6-deoxy-D-xylo-4-hexulose-3-dehydrase